MMKVADFPRRSKEPQEGGEGEQNIKAPRDARPQCQILSGNSWKASPNNSSAIADESKNSLNSDPASF